MHSEEHIGIQYIIGFKVSSLSILPMKICGDHKTIRVGRGHIFTTPNNTNERHEKQIMGWRQKHIMETHAEGK